MKAIFLKPGTRDLRIGEIPEPQITTDTQIKVKVLSVGICGTDREEAAGGRADSPPGESELIIGHEMIGKVTDVGAKVTRVSPNDFVVVTVRRGCDNCVACKAFRSDLCLTGNYTERGIKQRHGFHAEYIVDEEIYAVKVPPSIAHIAVLTEPMSVVEKAIEEVTTVQTARLPYLPKDQPWLQGKKAIVAGLGPIGLLASIILSLEGAKVFGFDRAPADNPRAKLLEKMGGVYINDQDLNLDQFQKENPDIHLILDAAGVASLDFHLIDLLGINGAFVLTGVPSNQKPIDINGAEIMRRLVLKNQVMLGSVNESIHHFTRAIQHFEAAEKRWPHLLESLITQRFPYTNYEAALTQRAPDEIKGVIDW
jgi:threonine dehydrogenase-like Zn-dependent dehydrogenase